MFHCHDPKQLEERIKQLYSQIQSSRYSNYPYPPSSSGNNNNSSSGSDEERPMKFKQQSYSHNHVKMGNLKSLTPHWGVRAPYHTNVSPAVIHPDVKFKELPFYSIIDNIIRPTALGKVFAHDIMCSNYINCMGNIFVYIEIFTLSVITHICTIMGNILYMELVGLHCLSWLYAGMSEEIIVLCCML